MSLTKFRYLISGFLLLVTVFFSTMAYAQGSPGDVVRIPGLGSQHDVPWSDWDTMSQTDRDALRSQCVNTVGNAPGNPCEPRLNGNTGATLTWDAVGTPGSGTNSNPGSNGNGGVLFGGRSTALMLFDYAVNSQSCMSCTFLSFFMVAMADFSYLVFQYFYDMFLVIAPMTIAIWLAYRAAKLMIMGGEDGKDFVYSVVGKVALFSVVWIIATGANTYKHYLWQFSGPVYLKYAFELSNEIRDNALPTTSSATTQVASGNSQLMCQGLSLQHSLPGNVATSGWKYEYIDPAVKSGCFTERTHVLGVSAGAALAFDSHDMNGNVSIWEIAAAFLWFTGVLIKILIGLFVAVSFGISAIWLIFLSLDVVARGMVTAAFSPILVLTYIYRPTRNVAVEALKGMAGALCTAVAIAIINIMAYVLVTNTPAVFEMTYVDVANRMDNWDLPGEDPTQAECGGAPGGLDVSVNRINAAYNFVCFVGVGDTSMPRIPMNFGTPWFWYLAFCGISIFALGRKVVKMIEQIVGYQGAAEMANSALKATKMATTVAAGGAMVAGGAGLMQYKAMGMMASGAGGAVGQVGKATAGGAGKAMNWIGGKMSHGNVLAASNIANTIGRSARDE